MRFDDLPHPAQSALRFMLHDEVRVFELFSALNLCALALELWARPEILDRPSYAAFDTAPSTVWAVLIGMTGVIQLAGMVLRH